MGAETKMWNRTRVIEANLAEEKRLLMVSVTGSNRELDWTGSTCLPPPAPHRSYTPLWGAMT